METLQTTPTSSNDVAARSLARAMREQDFSAMAKLFAPDVVLESPVTGSFSFRGREDVIALLRIVRGTMEGLEHFELLGAGDVWSQRFGARVRGRLLDGVDVLRFNADGQVSTMTVFLRPLPSLAAFAAAVAPPVAARRGRAAGAAVALLVAPLALMTGFGDWVVGRLLRGAWGSGR